MIPIYQNRDKKIKGTLISSDGTPIDIKTLTGIAIWLTYIDGTIFVKYSMNMTSVDDVNLSRLGFKQLKIVDYANGIIRMVIEQNDTANAVTGVLNFFAEIQYSDKDVLTGIFHKETKTIENFAEILTAVNDNVKNI